MRVYVRCSPQHYRLRPGCLQSSINTWRSFKQELQLAVGIATVYGLDGSGIESRWGARFSASIQTDRGAHPASCTMGTGGKAAGAWR